MSKIGLDQLTIEITRRCNMNPVCAHCFRGMPQNLDINTSTIDNLLEQVAEIGDLMFTGGEPLLNLKGIKHTFDRIKENNIKLSYVNIVTNGLICPDEFLDLIQDIDDYIKKWFPKNDNVPHVMLGISQDQYHNNDNGVKFSSRCKQAFKDRKIPVIPQLGGEDPYRVGNAKNLSYLVTNTYRSPENAEAAIDYWEPYRAKPSCTSFNPQNVVNCKMPIILCPLYLSAQGKLFTGDKVLDLEYTQIDSVKSICDLTSSVDIFDAIKRYNIGRKTCRFCFKHPKHEPTLHDVGTKAFRKFLKTCVLARGNGVILSTSSMVSISGQPSGFAYPASKFAVNGLTVSLARELGPKGIRVNAVAPGITETDMMKAVPKEVIDPMIKQIPLRRLGQPEDIANAFVFLASDEASYITGVVLSVDGMARS